MVTQYNVGEKVFIEAVIKNIKVNSIGIQYGVDINGRVCNFEESQVHPMDENDDGVKEAYEATLRALGNIENGN